VGNFDEHTWGRSTSLITCFTTLRQRPGCGMVAGRLAKPNADSDSEDPTRFRVDTELTGHLRGRFVGLVHDSHRASLEVPIELPSCCSIAASSMAMSPRYEGKPKLEHAPNVS
jgi:hypothetical protein